MSIGSDSANLGVATMLSSMTELPAMVLYARYSRNRKNGYALMAIAGWLWLVKDILTMLVRTPQALYVVQLMHFVTNAIYVPVMMDYVSRTLPKRMFIRAVALAGTANTLGCLMGSVLGGWLLDRMVVRSALMTMLVFALVGAICMTIGIRRAKVNVTPETNDD